MVGSAASQRLLKRVSVRDVAVAGSTVAAVGMFLLTGLPVNGSYARDLLVGLIPFSIGSDWPWSPDGVGNECGHHKEAGLASGLYNVARTVGGSLGLAIMSTLAASRTTSLLRNGATNPLAARVSGYHVAFLAAAVMVAIGQRYQRCSCADGKPPKWTARSRARRRRPYRFHAVPSA